eukprot:CAMPEP_0170607762 /NCGR_PEP_ID=MMETSP0224-20130122/21224_1 /TAXON_ID=285029 /ORGANISM="Togula jolla, Strain CCCM 725" /LENGTH=304 /DNA_ID=CAMNT_0010932943 /DNA_START=162 /DNA_END=1075 /DNA_ORIENTATION=+
MSALSGWRLTPWSSCCCAADAPRSKSAVDANYPRQGQQCASIFAKGLELNVLSHDDEDAGREVQELQESLPTGVLRRQLLHAVRQDDAPSVLQYIADGAMVPEMAEALRLAAHRGCDSVVRELVAVGLSANGACPNSGLTPLQCAAAGGHLTVCELLLEAQADAETESNTGMTALKLARKIGSAEVEELLERHTALELALRAEGNSVMLQRCPQVVPRVSAMMSKAALSVVGCVKESPESVRAPRATSVQEPIAVSQPIYLESDGTVQLVTGCCHQDVEVTYFQWQHVHAFQLTVIEVHRCCGS